MKKNKLMQTSFDTGEISVPYYYGYDCLDSFVHLINGYDPDRLLLVIDRAVNDLNPNLIGSLSKIWPVSSVILQPDEKVKNIATLSKIAEDGIKAGISRKSIVIAIGGGVIGNIAGMVAGLLYRGISLIHFPTTLMSASDSVLSLKQAINSTKGKNHLGIFYTPKAICLDISFLQTLPKIQMRCGLCEIVKNCLAISPENISWFKDIANPNLNFSEQELIDLVSMAIEDKSKVTFDDPYERGRGIVLEYGHTVGHAIETLFTQENRDIKRFITHGEAIGLGMLYAAHISADLGYLSPEEVDMHYELLTAIGAQTLIDLDFNVLKSYINFDNKRGYLSFGKGQIAMVLLERLGKPLNTGQYPLRLVDIDYLVRANKKLSKLNESKSMVGV